MRKDLVGWVVGWLVGWLASSECSNKPTNYPTNQLTNFLLFSILLFACGTATPSPTATVAPPAELARTGEDLNVLVTVEGEVRLKRAGWNEAHVVTVGTVVQRGDLLTVAEGGRAVVLCDDLSVVEMPASVPTGLNDCPTPQAPTLQRGNTRLLNVRGASDNIPYILFPRATAITNSQPMLRWQHIAAANSYEVAIRRGGENIWTASTSNTELLYDGEPLQVGVDYLLVVTADSGEVSTDEDLPGLGFSVLPSDELSVLQANTQTIEAHAGLTAEAKAIAMAYMYQSYRLYQNGIDTLEAISEPSYPSTLLLLGDMYSAMQLPQLAVPFYEQALGLAEGGGDLPAQAHAYAQLAKIGERNDDPEADAFLQEAITIYELLGDEERMEALK